MAAEKEAQKQFLLVEAGGETPPGVRTGGVQVGQKKGKQRKGEGYTCLFDKVS